VSGPDVVGAAVGLVRPGQVDNTTITMSTKHVTTTERVDLDPASAPECDFPGTPPALVDETAVDLEPTVTITETIGTGDGVVIWVGPDQSEQFVVRAGTNNFDVLTTYERVVTQHFQATAAGEVCQVLAAARFTG
jgi:hypothetical protein